MLSFVHNQDDLYLGLAPGIEACLSNRTRRERANVIVRDDKLSARKTLFISMSVAENRLEVSVLFATRDRADQLRITLEALCALTPPNVSWELLVADDGSKDATPQVLIEFSKRLPLAWRQCDGLGKNTAINAIMSGARGDLLVFTDDDVIPETDWLITMIAAASRWPDDAIFGGRIVPRFPPNTPDWLASPTFGFGTTAFARYEPSDKEGPVSRHPYGPNFAVRRQAIGQLRFPEHLGPYGTSYPMGGEAGFLNQLGGLGHRFIYVPTAALSHVVRPEQVSDGWLMNRALNKGRGQVYLPSTKQSRYLYVLSVPLRLWLAAGRSWIRYTLRRLTGNRRSRLEHGIQLSLRLGQILEILRLRRRDRD